MKPLVLTNALAGLPAILALLAAGPAWAAPLGEVFESIRPAVVLVHTIEREGPTMSRGREVALPGLGSGVIISGDGQVLTAAHVVQTADSVVVELYDGTRIPAAIIGSEPGEDVALLKLDRVPESIALASLGNSDEVRIGDQIFVVGAPYGMGYTMTVGHLSGRRNRSTSNGPEMGYFSELLQTDAAINQGNSGGPMFNMKGEVIGIVSHILSQSGGYEGLGFAVSSNSARQALLDQRTFWSGISSVLVSDDLARALQLPQDAGELIQRVAAGSPAARMGLRAGNIPAVIGGREVLLGGDILLAVEDIQIQARDQRKDMRGILERKRPGDRIQVTILRAGRVLQLDYFLVDSKTSPP